jgi:hypothetical protein
MTAIVPTDVQWYLSNPMANTGYLGTGTPGNSLGAFMSTTQISTTPLNDLFLNITPAENAAFQVDYQCLFLMNNTASGNMMLEPYVWCPSSLFSGSATIEFGVDAAGAVPYNSSFQQAALISNSTTEPVGVTSWYGPSISYSSGAILPDIPAQCCVALWFQRTATGTTLNQVVGGNSGFTIQVLFSTTD